MLALGVEKALSVLVIRSVGNPTMICKYISERGVWVCDPLVVKKKKKEIVNHREGRKSGRPMGVRKEGCVSRTESH